MSKIIFCGDIKFPHGIASANYVQCLASAFIDIGYEAIVCSTIDETEMTKVKNNVFRGIKIVPLKTLGGGFNRLRNINRGFIPIVRKYLDNIKLDRNDIIVSYAITPEISKFVLDYANEKKIKSMACPVEWFDATHYKGGVLSYHYWVFARNFYLLNPKFDYIFSISKRIHNFFISKKCNSLLIPCMIDTSEFEYKNKLIDNKIKILFPGAPGEKGAFSILTKALEKMDDTQLQRLEIHFTRVNKEQILPFITERLYDFFGQLFFIHGSLNYQELVELYQSVHYLFLCRESSRATLCNFPSKGPETMQYGVVPIVTNLGDFETDYLIDGSNAFITEELTSATVYNILDKILNMDVNQYLQLSNNARNTAVEKFDYHRWTGRIKRYLQGE